MKKEKQDRASIRETLSLTWRSFQIMNRYHGDFYKIIALKSICKAVAPYINIWLSAQIINELAGSRSPEVLWRLVVITVVVNGILALANAVLERSKAAKDGSSWFHREKIYTDKMLYMDFEDMDDQKTHDLRFQIQQNQRWSGWGIGKMNWYFETIVNAVCRIVGAIALTVSLFTSKVPEYNEELVFLNHPLFAVFIIVLLIGMSVLSPLFGVITNGIWASMAEDAKFGNRMFAFFGYLTQEKNRAADIRIYNQQQVCDAYLTKLNMWTPGGKMAKCAAGPMGICEVAKASLNQLVIAICYIFVCVKAWAGAYGVGSVTQYIGAITNMASGISELLSIVGDMHCNVPFLRKTFELLDIPNKMYQGSLTTEKRSDRQYEVEFKDVSFKYPGTDIWALRHVNMKFKIGSRLAVVGMNGSGKTTFIKLLCRLYDPTEGEILLNGIDIRKYRYEDYIDVFSVVFQDFQLLALPLGENIAGSTEYDEERVRKCLKDAGFDERLEDMPHGLETYLYKDIDKEGVEVSGGEAQKIAIARALYKDAPFIILDEPTAALDPIAEAEIYSKFNDIVGDKTAIYISHRLSSCKFCDEIAVFHEGTVIQQGSHEVLVTEESGKYYELWHAQAQYYTEKMA